LNNMIFEISNPLSPADCNFNSDTRTIGIAVKIITFSKRESSNEKQKTIFSKELTY